MVEVYFWIEPEVNVSMRQASLLPFNGVHAAEELAIDGDSLDHTHQFLEFKVEDPGIQVMEVNVSLTLEQFSVHFCPNEVAVEHDEQVWLAIFSDVDISVLHLCMCLGPPIKLQGNRRVVPHCVPQQHNCKCCTSNVCTSHSKVPSVE